MDEDQLKPPAGAADLVDVSVPRREPELLVSEERSPLPQVDRALPILRLFSAIVGRGERGRYRVALLKTLAGAGAGRWKIRELQGAIWWLEPTSVAELVAELTDSGVLAYNQNLRVYSLPAETRVAVAIIDALTFRETTPQRLVQWLSAAIELASQSDPDAAVNSFAQAVAILRADIAELRQLMEDGAIESLLEAAEKFDFDADDMDRLLERHEALRLERGSEPVFRALEADAFALAAQLHQTHADVVNILTARANELMLGGARVDRGEIRDFVKQAEPSQLAAILRGLAQPPPFLPWLPVAAAFDQLLVKASLERPEPPLLPEPEPIAEEPLTVAADATERMIAELAGLKTETTLQALTVRAAWEESVARHTALLDAYVRDERVEALPVLTFAGVIDQPRRGPVARLSRATVRPRPPAKLAGEREGDGAIA